MSSSFSETRRETRNPVLRALGAAPIAEPAPDSTLPETAAPEPAPCGRARGLVNLNHRWRFHRVETTPAGQSGASHSPGHNGDLVLPGDVRDWEQVNLPHSVRLEPVNASGGRNFQGWCWYVRDLGAEPAWEDHTVYLHFEGAMQVTDVWLNGHKIGSHCCGYTPFTIDITQQMDLSSPDAQNVLAVRLDNRDNPQVPPGKPQGELDFTYFGGLYRNVRLEVADRLHLTDPLLADQPGGGGVFVDYPLVGRDRATVRIRAEVRNDHANTRRCAVRCELFDAGGALVATATQRHTIAAGRSETFSQILDLAAPKLWHPHHPHLYTLRTAVCDLGARGGQIVDDHTTRIGIRRIRFDKDSGLEINGERFMSFGANRHQDHPYVGYALPDSAQYRDAKKLREAGFTSVRSHYPHAPAFMDACDELGLLTIVSNPGWQFVGDEVFRRRAVENARAMIRRDRNRPSVILWEVALNESDNRTLAAALRAAAHEELPGDQCYTVGDRETAVDGTPTTDWEVEYLHNDGSKPYWIREWGDGVDNWSDQQSRNRIARGFGELPMIIQARAHLSRMDEIMVGHHGSDSGHNTARLAGACLWAGIDCQRGYHHQPFYGGALDVFRLPKFNHYLFQSQRPPQVRVPGLDDGPMVFIANFATFLSPSAVTVFSNCEQVRLLRDGKEIALQPPDAGHRIPHPPFTFKVGPLAHERTTMYMTGVADDDRDDTPPVELRAEGLIDGRVVATHVVRPPGVASKLVLEADLCGRPLVADSSDWVRVFARVCDVRGTVCPFADDPVSFTVEGEGSIIGDASIGANPMRAEAGIATALVRGSSVAGTIVVRATAFGLEPASLALQSISPETASPFVPDGRRREPAVHRPPCPPTLTVQR